MGSNGIFTPQTHKFLTKHLKKITNFLYIYQQKYDIIILDFYQ